jgi:hypothetical protein
MRTPPLILIVDDNPANVEILQMRLAANHYEIITAADGAAGPDPAGHHDAQNGRHRGLPAHPSGCFPAVYTHHHGHCQGGFKRCRSKPAATNT